MSKKIIYVSDLQQFYGYQTKTSASKEYRTIKDSLSLKCKYLTVWHLAEYLNINYKFIDNWLNEKE